MLMWNTYEHKEDEDFINIWKLTQNQIYIRFQTEYNRASKNTLSSIPKKSEIYFCGHCSKLSVSINTALILSNFFCASTHRFNFDNLNFYCILKNNL